MTNANDTAAYLVIDLEATCCNDDAFPRSQMEIIEIGAVLVAAGDYAVLGEFETLIKPVRHPQLTPFCTQLTTIRQSDVAAAPLFAEAIARFKDWLYPHGADAVFCSWGDYDLRQLQQDCTFHGVPYPISAPHINVKKVMADAQGLAKRPGLGQAVAMAGLAFDGTPHRAPSDARNIVRLLPFIFGGAKLPAADAVWPAAR